MGSSDQPETSKQHKKAGGIFRYAEKGPSGNIVIGTEGGSKSNVKKW